MVHLLSWKSLYETLFSDSVVNKINLKRHLFLGSGGSVAMCSWLDVCLCYQALAVFVVFCLDQWFPTGGTRTPRGTQAHCRGYVETFNNHLCYVILFENHQHGGTHGMTNRLRGYTRQKRLGNTGLDGRVFMWFRDMHIPNVVLSLFGCFRV